MLENTKYDGRPVDHVFRPETPEGEKHHQVVVYYGDDKEPKQEVMSVDEWEAMKQTSDDAHQRLFYLQDATYNLRKEIMNRFEQHNPRILDLKRILIRVEDDMIGQLVTALYNLAFDKTDYITELTAKDVLDIFEKAGKEADFGDLDEKEQAILKVIAEQEFPIDFLVELGRRLDMQMKAMRDRAVGEILGTPLENLRVDDLIQFMEKKVKEREAKSQA